MSDKSSSASGGVGFAGLLTVLFIGLKLCHQIAWSWWWVLSPLWISWGLVLAVSVGYVAFVLVVAFVATLIDHVSDIRQTRRLNRALRKGRWQ